MRALTFVKLSAFVSGVLLVSTSCTTATPTPTVTVTETPSVTPSVPAPVEPTYPSDTVVDSEDEFVFDIENEEGDLPADLERLAIRAGRELCTNMDNYGVSSTMTYYQQNTASKDVDHTATLIAAAVVNLCPEYREETLKWVRRTS